MEHYKILGVDEKASMEEVTRAYKSKVNQFKEEINNEKRANAFIKVFDEAYEAIKTEREQNQYKHNSDVNSYEDNYSKKNLKNSANEDEFHDFEDDEYEKENRRSSSKNSSRKKQKNNKKKSSTSKNKDGEKNRRDKNKKTSAKDRKESSTAGTVTQMILKVLAIPVIIILSIIIFLCKIISLISWIASKVIIVAAIAISAIHGYQIYIGQPMRYEIFAISAVAFIVSLFLPSILKIVPSTLGSVNDRLKRFVFK
ncbi:MULTISPECIES: J domain-containing protein [Clostridium]|uniref:J domain-containing protein n=1 Tax=Clostridium cadaveris TaxID=1529 RepID=A0A1I2NJA4_9CLOT|nr:J domain-containing protein [Clostridium cadaveris]MDU4952549.1 J domain-containing protein [Clostridium sp.]MDM8312247.1 J domain-containing protein [Clostridium cadaveris]MDY4948785.1 J domain-containing protein [Clostridium cadaveris]NWK11918.1 J domain-containing protein [Clostridium cadaveris]PWL53693.1 MAG: J domain-containing protein [Clostridium cadaveris]